MEATSAVSWAALAAIHSAMAAWASACAAASAKAVVSTATAATATKGGGLTSRSARRRLRRLRARARASVVEGGTPEAPAATWVVPPPGIVRAPQEGPREDNAVAGLDPPPGLDPASPRAASWDRMPSVGTWLLHRCEDSDRHEALQLEGAEHLQMGWPLHTDGSSEEETGDSLTSDDDRPQPEVCMSDGRHHWPFLPSVGTWLRQSTRDANVAEDAVPNNIDAHVSEAHMHLRTTADGESGSWLESRMRRAAQAAISDWGQGHLLRSFAQQEAVTRLHNESQVHVAVRRLRVLSHEYGEAARLYPHAARRALEMAVATRQLAAAMERAMTEEALSAMTSAGLPPAG